MPLCFALPEPSTTSANSARHLRELYAFTRLASGGMRSVAIEPSASFLYPTNSPAGRMHCCSNPFAPLRFAPLRSAPLRSAPLRSALLRSASLRSASLRFAPLRFAPLRSAPLRFAPLRYAPFRYAPLRFAQLSVSSSIGALFAQFKNVIFIGAPQ